ncbi:helix-turn-helix domain-containing protein [Aquabacterium sp.]|uniref:helix-turn-helix domain-containing protein n=1 Tax=Aquabacterium sp. TaxID=1872578 RepID=UPI002B898B4E|nr:helix-turn-helix transcriptional regulator [Aquabacterium sp.]HSW04273.1 helix-turn-helix transcriptional regulator [Aquabacterium sp.]
MNLLTSPSTDESAVFGAQLRGWRLARGQSQLALALAAGVSTRHLSYLETGRAGPSREMVLSLSLAMALPLRSRNQLLMAAGFAPMYRETAMDAPAMGPVRDALQFMLRANEPNPTFVVDRRYDVTDANASGRWLLSAFVADSTHWTRPWNMAQLILRPEGMQAFLRNGDEVQRKVLGRLKRDLGGAQPRDSRDEALLREISPALARLGQAPLPNPPLPGEPLPLLVGLQLQRGELALNFFTTIATLGTTLDVTLQEMRIETLFPADAPTRAFLTARAAET